MLLGYFDGAVQGGIGPTGIGACIIDNGVILWEVSDTVGIGTVNIAEYNGLLTLLEEAVKLKIKGITIFGDSQLIVNQVNGVFQCTKEHLIPLCRQAQTLKNEVQATIIWVPRDQNKYADRLSKEGLLKYRREDNG